MNEPPKVSVIIPTYNEAENIGELLDRLSRTLERAGYDYEIIVVDDNSPDGTCNVVREASKTNPRIKCVLRVNERGLSSAVVEGFRRARGDILVVMDGDLQHPPEVVPRLVDRLLGVDGSGDPVDLVVASRYVKGGGVANWSRVRLLMSRAGTLGVKVLVPPAKKTSDPLSGFFAVRREKIDLDRLRPRGFKILVEILGRHPCLRVADVGYTFEPRRRGKSKLSHEAVVEFLKQAQDLSPMPKFLLVGATGTVVNLVVMYLVLAYTGIVDAASIAGIETSILWNFLLHEFYTFGTGLKKDCRGRGPLWRLAAYHRASFAAIITTYAVMRSLVILFSLNPLLAQFIGIIAGFMANYLLSTGDVWRFVDCDEC